MTNTDTNDVEATVAQCIRMADAGSEYIRITAQGVKEARKLAEIKASLLQKNYSTPLVADIHFNPKAAEEAAKHVEKIRINPGNYVDKYPKDKVEFSEDEYQAELDRIKERIYPLLDICKAHNTAIRIGTNHGSLSQRIMSRFGDTPEGMAESAMEFVRICHDYGFHQLVLSMKASNIRVMVASTRLLVAMMDAEDMNYPVHLGVTEAGDGVEGRIKSSAGIGCLLRDGIGDTIRVSLTEDPEKELPIARQIVDLCAKDIQLESSVSLEGISGVDPFSYTRRETKESNGIGGSQVPQVMLLGQNKDEGADFYLEGDQIFNASGTLAFQSMEKQSSSKATFLTWNVEDDISVLEEYPLEECSLLIIQKTAEQQVYKSRMLFDYLQRQQLKMPVLLRLSYQEDDFMNLSVKAAADTSFLLVDGLIDGVCIESPGHSAEDILELSLRILQANGARFSQTEFISCPSCGRTLFDIQAALAEVKERTKHLKGLKVAVMGCIVNGPGEMADADYGYVGAGAGKVSLYRRKQQVKNNVPENEAVDALIDLIKEHGDWHEPL